MTTDVNKKRYFDTSELLLTFYIHTLAYKKRTKSHKAITIEAVTDNVSLNY